MKEAFIIPDHKGGKYPSLTYNWAYTSTGQSQVWFHLWVVAYTGIFIMVNEAITDARDIGRPLYMPALDLQKTFDTVDYVSLLRKLLEFAVMVWVAISENF